MPTLFTESDFTAGRYDDKYITIGTNNGLSITNFSDQGFQATVQRTGETYVLPPYSLYTFPVQPNDSVIVQHLTVNYNASKIGDRYLRYDQVADSVEPKLIPLSSFPVYNQEITGNVSALIENSQINAQITNTTNSPAIIVEAAGSFDSTSYVSYTMPGSGKYLLVPPGNYITKLYFTINNFGTINNISFVLYNGNNSLFQWALNASQTVLCDINLANGMYNNGIYIYSGNNNALFLNVQGFVCLSNTTPRPRVATVQ